MTSYQVILDLIAGTTTETGLQVESYLDDTDYQTGIKVSDKDLENTPMERHQFHPDWNYTIYPR